ncbi:MAG: hypothetical protein HY607_10795 [Planctomycetes bacterium]|nr:hypothetical protein [Planctomycetota bacterium]MBI4223151.1 hypothetical protein [Planctomycetota bacterium]
MNEKIQGISEQEKEALKFLDRDFNQCFQQMRHYDAQIFDILKFIFTAYTTIIGVAIGLYQFGLKENKILTLPAIFVLSVGLLLGLFMFALAIRNRVYFVQLARYINEQRGLFLKFKPIGFENKSLMYTNPKQPPYFNWRSSQAWYSYIIASLNSMLLGALIFIVFASNCYRWQMVGISSILLFIIQLAIAISYLKSRENKSSSEAIFGKG